MVADVRAVGRELGARVPWGGGSILGTVTIKTVVESTKVTAFSDIRVLEVSKSQPVVPSGLLRGGL